MYAGFMLLLQCLSLFLSVIIASSSWDPSKAHTGVDKAWAGSLYSEWLSMTTTSSCLMMLTSVIITPKKYYQSPRRQSRRSRNGFSRPISLQIPASTRNIVLHTLLGWKLDSRNRNLSGLAQTIRVCFSMDQGHSRRRKVCLQL